MVEETELFSRDELSAGLPARRARARLYLIENRAALLASRDRRAVQPWRTETTETERDLAFLAAFAEGKAPPVKPTVQDLERYAADWAPLVPANVALRAALAHALAEKYRLVHAAVPGIREALGLDTEPVAAAYLRRYGTPLAGLYTPRQTPGERLRWSVTAFERWFAGLSPFWTAFALTFTEVLGAGALALPIALAGIGPLPGVVVLLVFGLVNILTIAALTEAVTRHGGMRFGAFLGQLFNDYLGPRSAAFAAAGLILVNALGLVAYFDGFATTMAGMIRLPPLIWMALLGLAVLYFLRGKSMDTTIGATLIISAVNLFLILALLLLTIPHIQAEYLLYSNVPFVSGQPFDASLLALIFGTVLLAFFGHTAVINGAGVMLRRDPGGRSFVRGAIAAEVTCTLLYLVWLLAVNGSVPPDILAGTQSTVLTPLAAVVGPAVNVFGLLFMLLAVAIASIQVALGLFNLVREWMPAPEAPTVVLPRRQGQLVLAPRRTPWGGRDAAGTALRLTYLGPALPGCGRFRIQGLPGNGSDAECGPDGEVIFVAGENWDGAALGGAVPHGVPLRLQVQQATPHWVRLRVLSPWALRYEGALDAAGLQMGDLLDLPPDPAQVLNYLIRAREAGPAEIAAATGQEPAEVSASLAALAAHGRVQVLGTGAQARYRAQFGRRRARQFPGQLAQIVDEPPPRPAARPGRVAGSSLQRLGPVARFWLAASPIVMLWAVAAVALLTGSESFTAPMAFSGTIVASLLSGIFPALLLAAGRRRGDLLPASAPRFLGHPLVLGGIYVLYLVGILLHGLIIWEEPVMRLSALAAVCLTVLVTLDILRGGYLRPRLVVELRHEVGASGGGLFAVSNAGRAAPASVCLTFAVPGQDPCIERAEAAAGSLPNFASLRAATFAMPVARARDLKVWVHRTNVEGLSEPLPAAVQVTSGAGCCTLHPAESGGQVLVPLQGAECVVVIDLDGATGKRASEFMSSQRS